MHGQDEKCIHGFGGELQTNRPLERFTHIDWKVRLKWTLKK